MSDKLSDEQWKEGRLKIKLYFDRPEPNEYQELYRDKLRNKIGFAMGLPVTLPEGEAQIERARRDDYCYFTGTSYEAIEVVFNTIYENTPRTVMVCVIPIVLVYKEKLYELPVFRVLDKDKERRFVDNCGRYYKDWDDWMNNNKLPPGRVIYPYRGDLTPETNEPEMPKCYYRLTPSNTTGSQVVKGMDITAAATGIGVGVASFFTDGLAIPVAAGVLSVYGLGRSVVEIVDRVSHGESVNPFTDSRARMVWLGVAANIGFGAMGASMRLASVAAKGKAISDTFKAVVNTLNAVSLTAHSACLVNGWVELLIHIDEAKPEDIVMQFLQTAFYLKGAYSYRTAGEIIIEARDSFFSSVTKDLNDQDKANFYSARARYENDAQFILFMRFGASGSPPYVAQILAKLEELEEPAYGYNYDYGKIPGEEQIWVYKANHFQNYPAQTRDIMFRVLGGNWQGVNVETFNAMKAEINEVRLFGLIGQIADHYHISPHDAARGLTRLYQHTSNNIGVNPRVEAGNLVLAEGHIFSPGQLENFQAPHYQALNNYLLPLSANDANNFNQLRAAYNNDNGLLWWMSKLPTPNGYEPGQLLSTMHSEGLMKLPIEFKGDGYIMLSGQLRVSLQRLSQLDPDIRSVVFETINQSGGKLDYLIEIMTITLRFKYEQQRQNAVKWINRLSGNNSNFCSRSYDSYAPHELDRLVDMQNKLEARCDKWKISRFSENVCEWAVQDAKTVSEFAAHIEYAMTKMEDHIRYSRNNSDLAKATSAAVNETIVGRENQQKLTRSFTSEIKYAEDNGMVGTREVPANLSDTDLITQLRRVDDIKFGSLKSAAYHMVKHPVGQRADYMTKAQATIRHPDSVATVEWSQDGTARTIKFTWNYEGRKYYVAVVLEDKGRVLICSFMKQTGPPLNRPPG